VGHSGRQSCCWGDRDDPHRRLQV